MPRRSAVRRPRRVPRTAARGGWDAGPAGRHNRLADRFPCRVGLVDERGALTFGQVHERANALANSMAERGVAAGDTVAIMCRNHRGFVEATVAAARLGTDVVSLDPALPTSQLEGVLKSSAPAALVFDEDFTKLLAGVDVGLRVLAWHDGDAAGSDTVESLVRRGDVARSAGATSTVSHRHPHAGHGGLTGGREPAGRLPPRGRIAAAAAGRPDPADRRATVPRLGLCPPPARSAAGLDPGAAA